jgi:peptidoglycan hydrolase-like protein with peptidoglycan-binding domain
VRNRSKFAVVAAVAVVVGAAGMSQASAAQAPTYTKTDVKQCAKTHEHNLIRPGDDVPCVRVLQQLLNKTPEVKALSKDSKPFLSVDGDYGPNTKKAVLAREKGMKWDVDGIVGKGHFESLEKHAPEGKARLVTTKPTSSSNGSSGNGGSSKGNTNNGATKNSGGTPKSGATQKMGEAPKATSRMGSAPSNNSDGTEIGKATGKFAKDLAKLL